MDEFTITNVAEAPATQRSNRAIRVGLEPEPFTWPDAGVNLWILEPDQPASLYHSEPVHEDFLVLSGRCKVIAEEAEHELGQWDYVHIPAGVAHVFVGAGEAACAVLMVGSRRDGRVHFPVGRRAARYGASVDEPTDDGDVAYAEWWREPVQPVPNPWPLS